MPSYEPDTWNETEELIEANNCYNYATNNKKSEGDDDDFPEPGKKNNKKIWQSAGRIPGTDPPIKMIDISCSGDECAPDNPGADADENTRIGVCAATRSDGLHLEEHCEDNEECWRVAVFYQPLNEDNKENGDFHYVREDTDADGNKTWSHKPGNQPVTNQTWNAEEGDWTGPPIEDPENDEIMGGNYKFCCYLCCCPDTEIAYVPFDDIRERGEYVVGIPASSSMTGYSMGSLRAEEIVTMLEAVRAEQGASWADGRSYGRLGFQLRVDDPALPDLSKVIVDFSGVTIWDPESRHFVHDGRATIEKLAAQVGLKIRARGRKV